jgi:hypothetical protein
MPEEEEIQKEGIKVVRVELPELGRSETSVVAFCPTEDCSVDECGCGGGDQY